MPADVPATGRGPLQLTSAPAEVPAPPGDEGALRSGGPVDVLESVHAVLVLDALHGLSPRCRAVLVLRHFCGLAIDETANALDLDDSRVLAFEATGLGAFAELLATARPVGVR
jgi:DNA-directed RNA polymerase specialized sigma24 family protein